MRNRVRAISGLGGKAPACFLLEAGGARLLLDLGEGPCKGQFPDLSGVGPVDALLITHGHVDHAGGLRLRGALGNPPVHATSSVLAALGEGFETHPLPLRGEAEVAGLRVRTGRNGHAPGGVWLHFDVAGGVLYQGDIAVNSLLYAFDPPPPAAVAIVDAAYGDYSRPLAACFDALAPMLDGPPVLLPAPAAGRGPEMALAILRSGRPAPALDEAHRKVIARLVGADRDSVHADTLDDLSALLDSAPPIDGPEGVMIAANAPCDAGTSAELVEAWKDALTPEIVITGHAEAETPAGRLLACARARFCRWNVHATIEEQAALIGAIGARTVLPAFASPAHLDAWRRAFAPARVSLDAEIDLVRASSFLPIGVTSRHA
jgi:Cft2 family RNA processing exonuclease